MWSKWRATANSSSPPDPRRSRRCSSPAIDGEALSSELTARVLAKLGFEFQPEPTLDNLRSIYGAWCRRVPFDNLCKLRALRAGSVGPLPGDQPRDFFDVWLRDGTGGTCWAGAGAMHALLSGLGFESMRVIATMASRPDAAPNHGTVMVEFDGRLHLVDSAILHDTPLPVDAAPIGWSTRWRPLHQLSGIDCRMSEVGVSARRFSRDHEATRAASPFNDRPYLRLNREDRVLGLTQGCRVEIDATGSVSRTELKPAATIEFLIDEIGISPNAARAALEP